MPSPKEFPRVQFSVYTNCNGSSHEIVLVLTFFKVILCLLGSCEEELLSSDGLEGAVEVMKNSLPPFAEHNVEQLVSEVLSLDISKDLESYEVSSILYKPSSVKSLGLIRVGLYWRGGFSIGEETY